MNDKISLAELTIKASWDESGDEDSENIINIFADDLKSEIPLLINEINRETYLVKKNQHYNIHPANSWIFPIGCQNKNDLSLNYAHSFSLFPAKKLYYFLKIGNKKTFNELEILNITVRLLIEKDYFHPTEKIFRFSKKINNFQDGSIFCIGLINISNDTKQYIESTEHVFLPIFECYKNLNHFKKVLKNTKVF